MWCEILKLEGRVSNKKIADGFIWWLEKNQDTVIYEVNRHLLIIYLALFLKRVIKNVRSHDFYSPFYSFLASRYLFRVTICKNYGSFFWVLRFLPF